ncbi:MAG: cysteine desulfurase [Bacteroidetes bacterium]|nr:cysteine desulfurase [Bacteroidota bacterium]
MSFDPVIYLDYNATTPVDPRVLETMLPYFSGAFGNPSSNHLLGWEAEAAVDQSRKTIARFIGAKPSEISFFSGATEALNTAIIGYAQRNFSENRKHIITCKTEHKAVLESCKYLETQGFKITWLDVNHNGEIDFETLRDSITDNTLMICLMLVNNETGVIHPLAQFIQKLNRPDLVWLADITQAIGKVPFNLSDIPVDMAVFSGHKIYGPKGVGVLYKKSNLQIKAISHGGMAENGLRAGTINVPAIVGLGKAIEIYETDFETDNNRIIKLRDYLESELLQIPEVKVNGRNSVRVGNVTNLCFENINNAHFLKKLNRLALSQGSACNANHTKPSHVLQAMGLSENEAFSSVRISLGRFTTENEIEFAIDYFKKIIPTLRK